MGRPNRYSFRPQRRSDDHTKVESTLLTKCGTLKGMGLRQDAATVGRALVSVVDDDESVRESLPALLKASGFDPRAFSSAAEFLSSDYVHRTQCLILDIAMPEMSGPELRRELIRRGYDIPTIFITAHADFTSQPDMREGAECLLKPFSETDLFEALKRALKLKQPLA